MKGDALRYHVPQKFSIKAKNSDRRCAETNAGRSAQRETGGWWHIECNIANLNGRYYHDGEHSTFGVTWSTWRGLNYSLKFAEMKVRPYGADVDIHP